MKITFKNIFSAGAALTLLMGTASCADELSLSIQDEQTNTEFNANAFLAKVYGSLVLTGQTGGAGNPDMSQFDEGNSAWYRRIFEANELCSDECIWTWQGDAGIPELTNISWNSSHGYNELTYYRLMYNVTLCNSYLDQTEGNEDAQVLQNRAEVRFLRALNNFMFVDMYGKAPYKEHVSDELPIEKGRSEMFSIIEGELKSIINGDVPGEKLLDFAGDAANYGRADKVAAYMLLARLYLNAEVYTGSARWNDAKECATKVIESQYSLNTTEKNGYSAYAQLFMGDNGENANARQEIIFPIRCDGATSRSYGGTIYTIASTTGSGTPDQALPSSMWTCNRARQSMINKFVSNGASLDKQNCSVNDFTTLAGDDRAMFFVDGSRTYSTEEKTTFTAGFGILKWTNEYCDPTTRNSLGSTGPSDVAFPDTDVPFMRVAEAYLTRAEADFHINGGGLDDVNILRSRAHAAPLTKLDAKTLCDEWCREFFFEGRRRSDLIRFGLFTSSEYLWDWKGGSYAGAGVSSIYNIYPIPANELSANANMTQNTGY